MIFLAGTTFANRSVLPVATVYHVARPAETSPFLKLSLASLPMNFSQIRGHASLSGTYPLEKQHPTNLALIAMQNGNNRLYPITAIEMLPLSGNNRAESLVNDAILL